MRTCQCTRELSHESSISGESMEEYGSTWELEPVQPPFSVSLILSDCTNAALGSTAIQGLE
ncbi:unnamed protein product [Penicillium roqueforti FM164]|uniref:Genomic scaffold, ProqFM164S04 n=1 Tax=Penicillium roqueforti (strain FM164) TaxID=1365484 RepID=W6QHF0_PENRF|nr:unnamed protein product [Penicillium roqueforti FM164]